MKIIQNVYKRTYIKSPVELCGSYCVKLCQQSNVKLLNLGVSCDFKDVVVLLVIFFSFSKF
jgi:hypothetical protein